MGQLTACGPDVWPEPVRGGRPVCGRCGGPAVWPGEAGAGVPVCLAYADLGGPGCPGAAAGEAARLVEAALAETPGPGADGDGAGFDAGEAHPGLYEAERQARLAADHQEPEADPEPQRWTRRRVLREFADLVEAGLPAPMTVTLYEHLAQRGTLALRLDNEATGEVDAWAGRLGLPPPVLGDRIDGVRPFRPYKAQHDGCWPGWRVELWCAVHEPAAGGGGGA